MFDHMTVGDVLREIDAAMEDVLADNPEVDESSAYADLVASFAIDCAPDVRAELHRRTGTQDRRVLTLDDAPSGF